MPWVRFDTEALNPLLGSLFDEPNCEIFETYSALGVEIQSFHSMEEFERAVSRAPVTQVSIWFKSVMPRPAIRRIKLRKGGFRETIEGCGLFTLVLEGENITKLGYWTEAGAKQRCTVSPGPDSVNWAEHKEASKLLRRLVKQYADS